MSFVCPSKHTPYSRWRLDVLSKLFATPELQVSPVLSFLYPQTKAQRASKARSYNTKRPSPDRNGPGPYDFLAEEGSDFVPNGSQKRPRSARPHQKDADLDSTIQSLTNSKARIARGEQNADTLGNSKKKFDPYSKKNRQDVKEVIKVLEDLTSQHLQAGERDHPAKDESEQLQESSVRQKEPITLVQSPIFKKRSKKEAPKKGQPDPAEQPLSHDPWARMLAEPVRLCKGSGVRLPMSLLSKWSLTKHPTTEEIFLMPSELADVEKLEKVSKSQERRRQEKLELEVDGAEEQGAHTEESDVFEALADQNDVEAKVSIATSEEVPESPQTDPSSATPLGPTSKHPGSVPAIRVLPYDNLINLYSLTALRQVNKRVNTTVRLLPSLWLRRFEEARQYERSRETFEKLTGEKDSNPPPLEATFDLNNLRWQTDIGERLLGILRRRVIVAFERGAMLNAQGNRIRLRHVSPIPMAKLKPFLQPQPIIPEADALTDTAFDGALPHDARIPAQLSRSTQSYEQPHTPSDEHTAERTLVPRLFLYLGPNDSSRLTELTSPHVNAMIPPLLPSPDEGGFQRFPVFPIRAMLGEESYREMLQLLKKHDYLEADKLDTLDAEGGDHLLMLKSPARNEFIEGLLRAVWRLWRYGGGRRWMNPSDETYEDWQEIVDEMHSLHAARSGKGQLQGPRPGIDDLVREVEEGAMEDDRLEARTVGKTGERLKIKLELQH